MQIIAIGFITKEIVASQSLYESENSIVFPIRGITTMESRRCVKYAKHIKTYLKELHA